jgi:hypothetical protein
MEETDVVAEIPHAFTMLPGQRTNRSAANTQSSVRARSVLHCEDTVVLVNLEVTDKLRIVILPSIPARACNFGAVCDSLGIIPDPNGTPG